MNRTTIIIANTKREADRLAQERGISPTGYRFVNGHHTLSGVRGVREADVLIADCWHETPAEYFVVENFAGRDIRLKYFRYPVADELAIRQHLGDIRIEWAGCR